ncbi:helix-turn-helix transcriptional regulator [Kitasatospora sp. NPDC093806]|uniref:helix-turn-helix domain-containing protein n=1 Tax=Kitasatospora sp. NPDC093806 TaxID=3155075 RepID=UPI00341A7778
MHDGPSDGSTDAAKEEPDHPRTLLVRALNDRLGASHLSLDRVVARLRDRLGGSDVRGLSTSSISRYLDPGRTELPDLAVLAELARIFRADPAELARWQRWHAQAKLAADHELRDRRAARRTAAAAEAPAATAAIAATAATADPVPEAAAPVGPAPAEESPAVRRAAWWTAWWALWWWPRRRGAAFGGLAFGGLALAAVAGGAVLWAGYGGPVDTASVTAPSASAERRGSAPVTPRPIAGFADGVEVGALGGDSRCSAPKEGPSGTLLRACAMVQPGQVLFAVRVDNPTDAPVEVTAKVAGFWAGVLHSCDPGRSVVHTTVAPGATFTSDPAECVTPRRSTPLAYQAEAFVAAGNGQGWVGHTLSPNAHVYPERETLWRCRGDVPC